MQAVPCSVGDPTRQQADLIFGESRIRVGRRHAVVGFRRGDAADEFALLGMSRHDGRFAVFEFLDGRFPQVEPQAALAV